MVGFYREKTNISSFEQGDVVFDTPLPVFILTEPTTLIAQEGVGFVQHPRDAHWRDGDITAMRIQLCMAIVLTQSCDIATAARLLLAPLERFELSGTNPKKQYEQVRKAATSLHEPTSFYLPASRRYGLGRLNARLRDAFSLPKREFINYATAAPLKRLGLVEEMKRHLQFSLAATFVRRDRDERDWQSADDLRLRIQWLNAEKQTLRGKIHTRVTELAGGQGDPATDMVILELKERVAECDRDLVESDALARERDTW